jgi:hypothetical protein
MLERIESFDRFKRFKFKMFDIEKDVRDQSRRVR